MYIKSRVLKLLDLNSWKLNFFYYSALSIFMFALINASFNETSGQQLGDGALNGVVMKGAYANIKQNDMDSPSPPANYVNDSLTKISQAGLNHIRFLFYWESYEKNPQKFMQELESVANTADRLGIKVVYDNHQWHTSSWLESKGTGFPYFFFTNNSKYLKGGGGNTPDASAKLFWGDWWDRLVKTNQGQDGWVAMSNFLSKIVRLVDNHTSTLGYEILSEPHVDNVNQWSKIGKFNSYMVDQLRNATQKTLIYSMNVPIDLKGPIDLNPDNLAKMAPAKDQNVAFKISVYGVPDRDAYQKERFDLFLKTRELTGIPLYVGEWNNVIRTQEGGIFKINPAASELTEDNAEKILETLNNAKVWATAFWKWDYRDADTPNFNLVLNNNGTLTPTKYYNVLKNSVAVVFGNSTNGNN